MPNPYFRFKQFTIVHNRCAMKVGTDGVLIGSWTTLYHGDKVLDVGTGSGLIALMIAQRNPSVAIDAIEIEKEAAQQANENFRSSPFSNISLCQHTSLQDFALTNEEKYDLIISNPPFFHRSLLSPVAERSKARHTDSLFIEDFIGIGAKTLTDSGRISFIFPSTDKNNLLSLATKNNLYVSRVTEVYPTPSSPAKRVLLEFSKKESETVYETLVIETERHVYSTEFIELIKDFYLKY